MNVTTDKMKEAVALHQQGFSRHLISAKIGISLPTVRRWIRQFTYERIMPYERDNLTASEKTVYDDLISKKHQVERRKSTIYQLGEPDFSTDFGDVEVKTIGITDNQVKAFKGKKITLALVLISNGKVISEPLYIDYDAFKKKGDISPDKPEMTDGQSLEGC